jgi:hypothetical protein
MFSLAFDIVQGQSVLLLRYEMFWRSSLVLLCGSFHDRQNRGGVLPAAGFYISDYNWYLVDISMIIVVTFAVAGRVADDP